MVATNRALDFLSGDVFMVPLRFRVDISDTLMYVYEMLGAELLSNLYDRLGRQLMDPQQSAVWQVKSLLTKHLRWKHLLQTLCM